MFTTLIFAPQYSVRGGFWNGTVLSALEITRSIQGTSAVTISGDSPQTAQSAIFQGDNVSAELLNGALVVYDPYLGFVRDSPLWNVNNVTAIPLYDVFGGTLYQYLSTAEDQFFGYECTGTASVDNAVLNPLGCNVNYDTIGPYNVATVTSFGTILRKVRGTGVNAIWVVVTKSGRLVGIFTKSYITTNFDEV